MTQTLNRPAVAGVLPNVRVSFLTQHRAFALVLDGSPAPVGPDQCRYWSRRRDLVLTLARYGLAVDRTGTVSAIERSGVRTTRSARI